MLACQASTGLGLATRLRMEAYSGERLSGPSRSKSAQGRSSATSKRSASDPRKAAEPAAHGSPQRCCRGFAVWAISGILTFLNIIDIFSFYVGSRPGWTRRVSYAKTLRVCYLRAGKRSGDSRPCVPPAQYLNGLLAACRRDPAMLRKAPLGPILVAKTQGSAPLMGERQLGIGAVLFTPTGC